MTNNKKSMFYDLKNVNHVSLPKNYCEDQGYISPENIGSTKQNVTRSAVTRTWNSGDRNNEQLNIELYSKDTMNEKDLRVIKNNLMNSLDNKMLQNRRTSKRVPYELNKSKTQNAK